MLSEGEYFGRCNILTDKIKLNMSKQWKIIKCRKKADTMNKSQHKHQSLTLKPEEHELLKRSDTDKYIGNA